MPPPNWMLVATSDTPYHPAEGAPPALITASIQVLTALQSSPAMFADQPTTMKLARLVTARPATQTSSVVGFPLNLPVIVFVAYTAPIRPAGFPEAQVT